MGNQGKKEARGNTRHRDKTQFRHQVTLNAQGEVSRSARGSAEAARYFRSTPNVLPVSGSTSINNSKIMSDQINHICKITCLQLRRISSIHHLLDGAATKKLVLSLVLSRLGYSSSLLAGLSFAHDQKTPARPNLRSKINTESTLI